jgi:chromatin remodeling complex protein RSC6
MAKSATKTATTATATPVAAAATDAAPKTPKAPKAPKAPKVAADAAPTVVVDAAPATAAEPKAAKAPKTPKAPKQAAAASTPAAPVVVVEAVSSPTDVSAVAASSVSAEFGDFMTKLQQLSTVISSLKTEFRTLEKKATRELKAAAKASHKRKRKTGNRSPSGFVKPTLISDELASFLGKTKGTEMARTEVTREINAYIRANQLQDKTNGRRINADSKLSSLLKLASGEELTYFNLQRYMSPHFAKTSGAAVVAH